MMSVLEIWGNVTIFLGGFVFATAALGVIRFPDAYTRISAVSTAGGLGIVLVITGSLMLQPGLMNTIQAMIVIAMQLITSAVGSIMIARSAYLSQTPLGRCFFNELDDATVPTTGKDTSNRASLNR